MLENISNFFLCVGILVWFVGILTILPMTILAAIICVIWDWWRGVPIIPRDNRRILPIVPKFELITLQDIVKAFNISDAEVETMEQDKEVMELVNKGIGESNFFVRHYESVFDWCEIDKASYVFDDFLMRITGSPCFDRMPESVKNNKHYSSSSAVFIRNLIKNSA